MDTSRALRRIFEAAKQLGLYDRVTHRQDWKEKLWTIAAHWGLMEGPCPYDELEDKPFILNLSMVLLRLQKEIKATQQSQSRKSDGTPTPGWSLDVSGFIR